ncbi:MAG: hypothetical protein ACRD0X_03625, partial [Thermoanaerobaculia bacterium]
YLGISSAACPFGDAGCGTGPTCDRVPVGAFCESDGECGLSNSVNNCGCIIGEEAGDWYVRIN